MGCQDALLAKILEDNDSYQYVGETFSFKITQ